LCVRTSDKAAQRRIPLPEEARQETVERVYRTLSGISQAIEMELPRSLRRRGKCYFRIDKAQDGKTIGGWDDDPQEQRFEMESEVQHRAMLLGELPHEFAEILAEVLHE